MEHEYTEDENSGDSVEILDETLSGEDELEIDEPETSSSKNPRRSTRTTVISRLNTSNEEEMQPSPDIEAEEGFEEQEEWKPQEKPKRRKKAPMTKRKRRERSEKRPTIKITHVTSAATGRPRGRPRRFTQQATEIPHSEGQFDIFDEDKTPERENEDIKEVEKVKEDTKNQQKTKEGEVITLEEDLVNDEKEDSDIIFIPQEEPDSPKPPTPEYSQPPQKPAQSVVVYGLEESEEEFSGSDSERTISDDERNFDQYIEDHEQYDPEEIERPMEEIAQGSGAIIAQGSGAIVIDTIQSQHLQQQQQQHQYSTVTINDEYDENTMCSVELELAQYAREDERNAQLDREMEEIGLKEDGATSSSMTRYREDRIDRSNIRALRLDDDDEVANDGMDFEDNDNSNITFGAETPQAVQQQQQQQQPLRHFIQIDDEIQEVYYGEDFMFNSPNNNNNETEQQHNYQGLDYLSSADVGVADENQEIEEGDNTMMYYNERSPESSQNVYYQESASPAASETSTIEITMSQLSIGGEVIEVPDLMLENESIFYHVLSKETFDSLSIDQQNHLKRFLPKTCETEKDVKKCINSAFNYNPNYYFGSPSTRAFNRIRAGYFNVDRPSDLLQLQDNRRVWYDHFIRQYYMKLLKRILLTRHAILEQAANLPEHAPIKINCAKFSNIKKRDNQELIKYRAKKRAKMLINFAAEKTENDSPSSDDSEFEDDDNPLHLPIKHQIEGESTHFNPEYANCDLDMYQPAKMKSIKELLKEHKALKKKNPNCPSLDTSDITLEDVYERSGLSFQSERNFAFP
uniref:Uncharacterized protein n=1 Tax=Panagrolaimus sp. PS1159 TaxID=55785 RepID=A0AC35FKL6_9BILA